MSRTPTVLRILAVAVAAALACAGAAAQTPPAPAAQTAPQDLADILNAAPKSPESAGIPQLRYNALRETGVTYGAQAGLARRSYENQQKLERQAQSLDVIYNFQALMIEGNVIPPVLSETSDVYDQSSEDMLRVIGKVYRIEQQARFTYVPPTWRAYMLNGFDFDANLVAAVAPQNDGERALWRSAVEEGFKLGAAQADEILKNNFATLQRDFLGMVLYHRMLDNGMVTRPFVAANRSGVTRSKDGSMHVGETFLRITAAPDFVEATGKWKSGEGSIAHERLRRMLDPDQARQMQVEAIESGRVKEVGR